jgi:hypothetical protein
MILFLGHFKKKELESRILFCTTSLVHILGLECLKIVGSQGFAIDLAPGACYTAWTPGRFQGKGYEGRRETIKMCPLSITDWRPIEMGREWNVVGG